MNNPLVSILIPVYNAEKTIRKCVFCALNQTYKNIEIIIIDDCSKDNSVKVIKDIINTLKDNRIKFFKNTHNLGLSGNWNECLRKANGEFVHYLHCDDLISSDCIEKKINIIAKNQNINLVFSATRIIDKNDKTIYKRNFYKHDKLFNGAKLSHKSFVSTNIFGEPSNVLFRKEALKKTGYFSNSKYALDWEMWIKISCLGFCYYINNYLSQYRISKTNLTSKYNIIEILKDDKIMVENLNKYQYIDFSFFEKFMHKFNYSIRTIFRKIYILFVNTFHI